MTKATLLPWRGALVCPAACVFASTWGGLEEISWNQMWRDASDFTNSATAACRAKQLLWRSVWTFWLLKIQFTAGYQVQKIYQNKIYEKNPNIIGFYFNCRLRDIFKVLLHRRGSATMSQTFKSGMHATSETFKTSSDRHDPVVKK